MTPGVIFQLTGVISEMTPGVIFQLSPEENHTRGL